MSKLYARVLQYVGIVIFLFVPGLPCNSILGQEPPVTGDSVFVPRGYMVKTGDTVLQFPKDTTLVLPGNRKYKVKKDKEYRADNFYGNFKDKSQENLILRSLYDAMIREQKDSLAAKADQKTENYHPEWSDKTVGRIDIIAVDLIDGDVNDPSASATTGYAITLNKLHKDTRTSIIRKNLTIREGDLLGAYTLADNEYHLRSLEYIEDARIFATTDSLNPGTVNILVVVKDVFPFIIGLGMGGITDYTVEVKDINIRGSGHEFSNSFRYNNSNNPAFGYKGELIFNNLWGSFIDTKVLYKNDALEELSRITLVREFITPETKYGGGVEFYHQQTAANITISDSIRIKVPYTKNYFDQWVGRSFLLDNVSRKSLVLKARYMSTYFGNRPAVESDTNQQFYNLNLLIGSITLLRKNHYKERMLLGYGMVEDIDFGYAIELTAGYQFSEYFKAPYVAFSVKAANKYNAGYFAGGIEYGGHIYRNTLVLGLFRTGFTYYSPLFKTRLFNYRLITRLNYTQGIRRWPHEILNLGREVRGASNSGIEGDQRFIGRFEFVTFLRGSLLGFRFSPNIFYDAAFIGKGSALFSEENFFSVAGMGVRIRNENLAFKTIIIRVGYYTGNPIKDAHFGAGASTSVPDVIREYDIVKPDLLRY